MTDKVEVTSEEVAPEEAANPGVTDDLLILNERLGYPIAVEEPEVEPQAEPKAAPKKSTAKK